MTCRDKRIFPLAKTAGTAPESPDWFTSAVAQIPSPSSVAVDGALIETYLWGQIGAPGLLFVHGARAHAGWWNFLVPLLATSHRVASISLSGMGGSQWRNAYSLDGYADELLAVAEHAELLANSAYRPILIAHSFGARAAVLAARRWGERLGGCIIVDAGLLSSRSEQRSNAFRTFKSEADALARFRFAPPQECRNSFIVRFLARNALRRVSDGSAWVWRFDPAQSRFFGILPDQTADLRSAQCPLAFVYGARSQLTPESVRQVHREACAPETPAVSVADAHHHVMADQPLPLITELRLLINRWHSQSSASARGAFERHGVTS